MKIQFNTDKTISGSEDHKEIVTSQIEDELERYQSRITRVEVYLKDQNGIKEGVNDIACTLEARLEGKNPIAVSHQADTTEQAVSGAIDKLKASIESIVDRMQHGR